MFDLKWLLCPGAANQPPKFVKYPKIPRLSREILITEKIDGTNAQIFIDEKGNIFAGSRTRWVVPESEKKGGDNHGFAQWVKANAGTLTGILGSGHHYGEWWGFGINRGYDINVKRFSLFNVSRWEGMNHPVGLTTVPILYRGEFSTEQVQVVLERLALSGSKASRGYMKPEGIVIYHTAGNVLFKKTFKGDEKNV